MKKIWIILFAAALVLSGCKHPYMEGMVGEFPFIDCPTKTVFEFEADKQETKSVDIHTNMSLTPAINYTEGSVLGWLTNVKVAEKSAGIVSISFTVGKNMHRSSRSATITLKSGSNSTGIVFTIKQKEFRLSSGQDYVCDRDLYLDSQESVDDCLYTRVNGKLIISGYEITDLRNLAIKYVRDGIEFKNINANLVSYLVGSLSELSVPKLLCDDFKSELVENWTGTVSEVEFRNSRSRMTEDIARKFSSAKSITICNCMMESFEKDLASFVNLETISLEDNEISRISKLRELPKVKTINLSGNPVCEAQIRALTKYLPGTVINASRIDSSSDTYVNLKSCEAYSAQVNATFTFTKYDRSHKNGIIIAEEGGDWTESQFLEIGATGNGSYTIEIPSLESGKTYTVWSYMLEEGDEMYISEPITFTTFKVTLYNIEFKPVYPAYEGENEVKDFENFKATQVTETSSSISSSELTLTTTSQDTYTATVGEGSLRLFFDAYDGSERPYLTGFNSSQMEITSKYPNKAIEQDYVTACYIKQNVDSDIMTTQLEMKRPTAKLSVYIDFSSSIGDLSDIKKISLKINNFYESASILNSGVFEYSGKSHYLFESSKNGVAGLEVLSSGGHVFPSISGEIVKGTLDITSGNSKWSNEFELKEEILANRIYEITIPVSINRINGSFTIEEPEIVEIGEIEF